MKLYEIPEALRQLEAQIEEAEGLLTPELEAQLDALSEEFDSKAEFVAMLVREAKLEAEKWKTEEERVSNRRRSLERRAEGLTRYLHTQMTAMGKDKIPGQLLTVAIQRNSQPTVAFDREAHWLPEEYRRVKFEMDAKKLREDHEAGKPLPEGVTIHHGTHVRIR